MPAPRLESLRHAEWIVACLCAEWCGSCRDYRPGFEALAADYPDCALLWIDVEDEAAWAGDYDVEDFPTLLIQRAGCVLFYGALPPHPGHLRRLLDTFRAQTPEASRAYVQATPERRAWQALDLRRALE
jgi:thioredoxin